MGNMINVLLVDDDPGDVELTREGLSESKVIINLYVAEDGEKALQFLRKEGAYTKAPRPDIILLDLNMPKKDGRQTLAEIKSDSSFRKIPVVVLTTSESELDIETCYALGANCYIPKPVSFDAFRKVVQVLEDFWFTVVRLPK